LFILNKSSQRWWINYLIPLKEAVASSALCSAKGWY